MSIAVPALAALIVILLAVMFVLRVWFPEASHRSQTVLLVVATILVILNGTLLFAPLLDGLRRTTSISGHRAP